jgi:RHS repeat-associated protein
METESGANGLTYRYTYGLNKVSAVVYGIPNGAGSVMQNFSYPSGAANVLKLYYHQDRLGSTAFLTDNVDGKVTSFVSYDDWGDMTGKAVLRIGVRELDLVQNYTGYPADMVLGVYYAKARMYDAADRRFMAEDPYWNSLNRIYGDNTCENLTPSFTAIIQSCNLYAYVLNNPINYNDPKGKNACEILELSWSLAGEAALADGPSPVGDITGLVIGIGGTLIAGGVLIYDTIVSSNERAVQEAYAMMSHASTAATPPPPDDPNSTGTRTSSKKLYSKKGIRIDVENPGNRPGQIHVQKGREKYIYDVATQSFRTANGQAAPKAFQELLKIGDVVKAIAKGLKYLGY